MTHLQSYSIKSACDTLSALLKHLLMVLSYFLPVKPRKILSNTLFDVDFPASCPLACQLDLAMVVPQKTFCQSEEATKRNSYC